MQCASLIAHCTSLSTSATPSAQRAAEQDPRIAGVFWYSAICRALGVDDRSTFHKCIQALTPEVLKGPFNIAGRTAAGMPQDWCITATFAI